MVTKTIFQFDKFEKIFKMLLDYFHLSLLILFVSFIINGYII
jgi:hypothetical protein